MPFPSYYAEIFLGSLVAIGALPTLNKYIVKYNLSLIWDGV